ncbi:MAG: hypothetical protein CMF50_00300 [Legionellales bacterium]|nr:hypothetical protein [Legionellales bacterium]|tara:strand:- start:25452 stop:26417 length:966 start_codon:yes stop_codon:yes gene_type:complete
MIVSKERLLKEKKASGYRQEIIEKVAWLIEVLNAIADDSYLSSRLALKGGTALNLFYFDLPRLSVDADFNYVGSVDRSVMLEERRDIEKRIIGLFERMGLTLIRHPTKHAGGKMTWRYPSTFGNQGNIEVDLNFMYRIPLLPVKFKNSITVTGKQVNNLQILDIHELAAGKLTALLDRQAGRDIFDANELFQHSALDKNKLRVLFVLYAAMSTKKDLENATIDDVTVNHDDLKNKLVPVMRNDFAAGFPSIESWTSTIIDNVRRGFEDLLPFSSAEKAFIQSVKSGTGINPELFITGTDLVDVDAIKKHPALLWSGMRTRK